MTLLSFTRPNLNRDTVDSSVQSIDIWNGKKLPRIKPSETAKRTMPGLKFATFPLKWGEKNQQQQEMGWKVEQGKEFIDFIKDYRTWLTWEAHTPIPKCLYLNHIKFFSSSRIFLAPISSNVSRLIWITSHAPTSFLSTEESAFIWLNQDHSLLSLTDAFLSLELNKVIKNGDYKDMTGMIKELSVLSQRFNDFFTQCQTAKLSVFFFLKIGFA